VNPHEVKHWIDPNIIPYGWGLFKEEDEVKLEEKGEVNLKVVHFIARAVVDK
jgi:hypothetical protein